MSRQTALRIGLSSDEFWEMGPAELRDRVDAWQWRTALWITVAGNAMGANLNHEQVYRDMRETSEAARLTPAEVQAMEQKFKMFGLMED